MFGSLSRSTIGSINPGFPRSKIGDFYDIFVYANLIDVDAWIQGEHPEPALAFE